MLSLALKYRPATFSEVRGQDFAVRILTNSFIKDCVSNAYLFAGSYGLGKTSVARIFSKTYLCLSRVRENFCATCDSCIQFDLGTHPHFVEIDGANSGLVSNIRKVLDAQTTGVIIIDEAQQMSKDAQSLLLKHMEEEQSNILFVFCTTNAEKVLDTVKSRCIEVTFNLLKQETIVSLLKEAATAEHLNCEDAALEALAKVAKGHCRDAYMLLDQVSVYDDITLDFVTQYYHLDVDRYYEEIWFSLDNPLELEEKLKALMEKVTVADAYGGIARVGISIYMGKIVSNRVRDKYQHTLPALVKELYKNQSNSPSYNELLCDLLLLETYVTDYDQYKKLPDKNIIKKPQISKKDALERVKNKTPLVYNEFINPDELGDMLGVKCLNETG